MLLNTKVGCSLSAIMQNSDPSTKTMSLSHFKQCKFRKRRAKHSLIVHNFSTLEHLSSTLMQGLAMLFVFTKIGNRYLPHIPCENPTASRPWGKPKGPSDGIGIPGGKGPCGTEWWECGPPYVCGCGPKSPDFRKPAAIKASVECRATVEPIF